MNPLLTLFEITGNPNADSEHAIGCSVRFGPGTQTVLCPGCRRPGIRARTDWNAVVNLLDEDAKYFPDIIGGFHRLISERVRAHLVEAGATGFVAHPVTIDPVESPLLRQQPMPTYYLLEVTGRVDIDRQLFDEGEGTICEVCRNWSRKKGGKYGYGDKVVMPHLETWDGSDFVKVHNIKSGIDYCTLKVVNLAVRHKWTGFGIQAFTSRLPLPDISRPDWLEILASAVATRFPDL